MALLRHFLLAFASLCIICIFTAESTDPVGSFCNTDGNGQNSQTSANILKLLSNLVPAASRAGYATASYGGSGNKVYGQAQCRSDLSTKDCSSCIQEAAKDIRTHCPADAVDARIWYDFCFLRYSTDNFFGKVDTGYVTLYANVGQVSDPDGFIKKLRNLVGEITKQAILPENKGLGKGKRKLSTFVTLYALVQCTRDLSPVDCAQCVAIAVGDNFRGFCKDSKGCRVIYSSCYVRYELYPFYFPLDSPENSTVAAGSEARKYRSTVVYNYKP